jgi:hypothetical protein
LLRGARGDQQVSKITTQNFSNTLLDLIKLT